MANLETLELTIKANAESATQGVGKLINSLSFLSKEIGKNVGALKSLNSELSKLKSMGKIRIVGDGVSSSATKNIQKQTQAITAEVEARKQLIKATPTGGQSGSGLYNWGNTKLKSTMPTANVAPTPTNGQSGGGLYNWNNVTLKRWNFLPKEQGAFTAPGGGGYYPVGKAPVHPDVAAIDKSLKDNGTIVKMKGRASEVIKSTKQMTTGFEQAEKASQSFGNKVSKAFSRIGRIASTMLIRTALRSLIKAFSESWNAAYEFSKGMGGQFAESVDKAKTLLAGATTSIVTAFSPAITAMLPVIQSVVNAIRYLCQAIQWLFSLLGMSNELFGASTDAINGYAKSAGGGGKANKEMLASFDELNVISQESGGGGGGGGGSSYVNGMFSDAISAEMAKIQLIVSESMLGLGLILACTGHIGIGVGLMAIGAAGIAKTVFEDWNKLPSEMQQELTKIMAIVGGASLAIGAILAFTGANIPLGIGLMAIGGVNLAAAIVPNWNLISAGITNAFRLIESVVLNVWNNIKSAAQTAFQVVSVWWEDSGIGPLVRKAWGSLTSFFKGVWEDVSKFAYDAWITVGKWWKENVTNKVKKEGIWGGVKGFFQGLWKLISDAASGAWDTVKQWWESSGIGEWVRRVWNDVGNFLSNSVWKPIKNAVTGAWDTVTKWWEDSGIGGYVRGVWNSVVDYLKNTVWSPIETAITNAWTAVSEWWNDNISSWFEAAWNFVKGVFEKAFKPIHDALKALQELLDLSGKKISTTVEVVQKITQEGSTENATASVVLNTAEKTGGIAAFGAKIVKKIFGLEANGFYGIPQGEVFVAQEHGAELVGEINGKTSVANQGQIIEGISSGVERANESQNALLREQNSLLRGILEKEMAVKFGASASFGRTVKQSLDMYSTVGG